MNLPILSVPILDDCTKRSLRDGLLARRDDATMSADASLLTLPASSNSDDCATFVAALGAAKGGAVEDPYITSAAKTKSK